MNVGTWVLIAVAGGAGATLRFVVDEAVRGRFPADAPFPAGILVVNITGAFVLGLLTGLALDHDLAVVAGTGFVGAYTTFSTWMLDTVNAASSRLVAVAVGNVVVSLALGLTAAALGRAVGAGL